VKKSTAAIVTTGMRRAALGVLFAALASAASAQVIAPQSSGSSNNSNLALIGPTAPVGTNNNQIATTAFVQTAVTGVSLPALPPANIFVGSAGSIAAAQPMSGDCTITILGAIACPKANGVTFAPSATTDTTNAANISSGTLPIARLANLGTTTVLHGNAAGTPAFGAVALGADVTGQLPFANGGCNGTTQQT
jgi:hypothetical protein